jgi:hypothetical protein
MGTELQKPLPLRAERQRALLRKPSASGRGAAPWLRCPLTVITLTRTTVRSEFVSCMQELSLHC